VLDAEDAAERAEEGLPVAAAAAAAGGGGGEEGGAVNWDRQDGAAVAGGAGAGAGAGDSDSEDDYAAVDADDNPAYVTRRLLAHGADVNLVAYPRQTDDGREGRTALHIAAESNSLVVAQLLLAHGARVNARTTVNQYTPLHCASAMGHVVMVVELLRHGADTNARTASQFFGVCAGGTPADYACGAPSEGRMPYGHMLRRRRRIRALLDAGGGPSIVIGGRGGAGGGGAAGTAASAATRDADSVVVAVAPRDAADAGAAAGREAPVASLTRMADAHREARPAFTCVGV
jgi:hypothetical protein